MPDKKRFVTWVGAVFLALSTWANFASGKLSFADATENTSYAILAIGLGRKLDRAAWK